MNPEATCVPHRRLLLAALAVALAVAQLLLAPCAMAFATGPAEDCEHCATGDDPCLGTVPAPAEADAAPVPGRARAPDGPLPAVSPAPSWHLLLAGPGLPADDARPPALPIHGGERPLLLRLVRFLI